MSAELHGKLPIDGRICSEAGILAARVCVSTGAKPQVAYEIGANAGTYAAEIVITTLRDLGVIPDETVIDLEHFRSSAEQMLTLSNVSIE